jgi:hypothetical protein
MPKCAICGADLGPDGCAEVHASEWRCTDYAIREDAAIQYRHGRYVRPLVDALRQCAPYARANGRQAAERALKPFGEVVCTRGVDAE